MNAKTLDLRRGAAAAVSVLAAGLLLATSMPARADHGLPHPELLGQGFFVDDVGLTLRNKVFGQQTHVVRMQGASNLFVLRITIGPGAIAPWHNHEGVGFLVNLGPGTLTNFLGDDCQPRQFYPGDAFIDPGHDELHAARNDSDEDVVILATFVATDGPPVIPAPAPEECSHVLD